MPQPVEPVVAEAILAEGTLMFEGFVLDESTLVRSSVLSYVAMIVSLIEGRTIRREEVLLWLRTSMRQRSMGGLPHREYVLRYLHQHPP